MIINLHFTSRKIETKRTQTNNITRSPNTNIIPESTWISDLLMKEFI